MQGHAHALAGMVVVLALLACKETSDSSSSTATTKKDPEVTTTAKDLQSEYKANEARADAKFKGKVIKISGKVASIDSDFSDDPVVHLESGEFIGVSLHDLAKDVAINLNKGDDVTFVCEGGGEIAGSPILRKCRKP